MKPLLVTSGEPSGVGPELCLSLANLPYPVVVVGDPVVLAERAKCLGQSMTFETYHPGARPSLAANCLTVLPLSCARQSIPGQLDVANAAYVIEMLSIAAAKCLDNEFSALVTAPVHKGILNQAGYLFTGHTEFLAAACQTKQVVMMLASPKMKVALVTTHVPLAQVPQWITEALLVEVIQIIDQAYLRYFGRNRPNIYVAGLNPHAGEGGYLGDEELRVITPALTQLSAQGLRVYGPCSADTMFMHEDADVFVAMYHDQGLPVLKTVGFGDAVNVTLGLPMIRTSVDHGTALTLAGTGRASASSLLAAVNLAHQMVKTDGNH